MKDLKEIWLGLCGAAYAAWEMFVDWWDVSSAKQKWVLVGACAIALLFLSTCAFGDTGARYKEGSIMGMVQFPQYGLTFACPMENEVVVTGRIYLCTVLHTLPNGLYGSSGEAAYCVQTRVVDGIPVYDCGPWEFIAEFVEKVKGI